MARRWPSKLLIIGSISFSSIANPAFAGRAERVARANAVRDVTAVIVAYRNLPKPKNKVIVEGLVIQGQKGLEALKTFKNYTKVESIFDSLQKKMFAGEALSDDQVRLLWGELAVSVVPSKLPDYERGRQGYEQHCLPCHGPEGAGNGQFAEKFPNGLRPLAALPFLSPYTAYAAIQVGVASIKMPSFNRLLGDQDAWNVAFYTAALPSGPRPESPRAEVWQGHTLADLTYLSQRDLEKWDSDAQSQLRWWGPRAGELSRGDRKK